MPGSPPLVLPLLVLLREFLSSPNISYFK